MREFVRMAFGEVGIEVEFKGKDEKEVGIVTACKNPEYQIEIGKEVIAVDARYYRPTEVDLLIGDPTKSQTQLGWKPKYDLAGLVKEMMENDVDLFKKEVLLKQSGYYVRNQFE